MLKNVEKTEKLYSLFDRIPQNDLSYLDKRFLDIAHKACYARDLDLIIESTDSISLQDYALAKRGFFYEKENNLTENGKTFLRNLTFESSTVKNGCIIDF